MEMSQRLPYCHKGMLYLVILLLINGVTSTSLKRYTTRVDSRGTDVNGANEIDVMATTSNSPPNCHIRILSAQEEINNYKEALLRELAKNIYLLQKKHEMEKKQLNSQIISLIRVIQTKDSSTRECRSSERNIIQLDNEELVLGFINKIRKLEEYIQEHKDEKELILEQLIERIGDVKESEKSYITALVRDKANKENLTRDFTELLERNLDLLKDIQTKNIIIEEFNDKDRKCREEKDKLNRLNTDLKAHNRDLVRAIQTKNNLIEEYKDNLRESEDEKETFKREIMELKGGDQDFETINMLNEEFIRKDKKCKQDIEKLKREITDLKGGIAVLKRAIESKDSSTDECVVNERVCKEENEKLNSFNAELKAHNGDLVRNIQTKDFLIKECKDNEREHYKEKEGLQTNISVLQNQINDLEKQLAEKQTTLQDYLSQYKEGIWKNYADGAVPQDAVVVDEVDKGDKLYLCRAEVEGEVVPGDLAPANQECLVLYNRHVYFKTPYEVLAPSSSFQWIPSDGDNIPPNAVPVGRTKGGEVLYAGRIKQHNSWYHVGKVQRSLKGCYNYNRDGTLGIQANYEILVWK